MVGPSELADLTGVGARPGTAVSSKTQWAFAVWDHRKAMSSNKNLSALFSEAKPSHWQNPLTGQWILSLASFLLPPCPQANSRQELQSHFPHSFPCSEHCPPLSNPSCVDCRLAFLNPTAHVCLPAVKILGSPLLRLGQNLNNLASHLRSSLQPDCGLHFFLVPFSFPSSTDSFPPVCKQESLTGAKYPRGVSEACGSPSLGWPGMPFPPAWPSLAPL